MIEEAIVLVGGLGTRIRGKIGDIPKPMAPLGDKPFLSYLLKLLIKQGIKKVVLAVGYKKEYIYEYFGNNYKDIKLIYSFEEENNLLGTGGAILKACEFIEGEYFFVFNGDTFFHIDLEAMSEFHKLKNSDITIALKPTEDASRYGSIELNESDKIVKFIEKGKKGAGAINGGIYLISKSLFKSLILPEKFSFETDFLQKYYKTYNFYGIIFDRYFIDIGVPEDYERAKLEIPTICR